MPTPDFGRGGNGSLTKGENKGVVTPTPESKKKKKREKKKRGSCRGKKEAVSHGKSITAIDIIEVSQGWEANGKTEVDETGKAGPGEIHKRE